jgi:hypothetical protein
MANRKRAPALTAEQVEQINRILRSGNRVELIPVRNGVRIVEVRRTDVSLKTER